MKLTLLFAALFSLPVVLMAEAGGASSAASASSSDTAPAASGSGTRRAHPILRAALRHRLLKKFDADHDGQLSAAERDTAKAAVREKITTRRAERFQKLDTDGNGQISRAEWDAASASSHRAAAADGGRALSGHPRARALRHRMLNRFDADKDGLLSPAERAEARADLRHSR